MNVIVKIKKPFKDVAYYRRIHTPGDIVELPKRYVEELKNNGLVEDAEKGATVKLTMPKPPVLDNGTGKESAAPENKAESAAPKNKAKDKE